MSWLVVRATLKWGGVALHADTSRRSRATGHRINPHRVMCTHPREVFVPLKLCWLRRTLITMTHAPVCKSACAYERVASGRHKVGGPSANIERAATFCNLNYRADSKSSHWETGKGLSPFPRKILSFSNYSSIHTTPNELVSLQCSPTSRHYGVGRQTLARNCTRVALQKHSLGYEGPDA